MAILRFCFRFLVGSALAIASAFAAPRAAAALDFTEAARWAALKSGMTEAELTSALGSQREVKGREDFKILVYGQGEVFVQDGRVVAWKERKPVRAAAAAAPTTNEARSRAGLPSRRFTEYVRAYEPNEGGQTWDQGNDNFFDFTFSIMLPLVAPVLAGDQGGTNGAAQSYPPIFRHPAGADSARVFRPLRYYSYRPGVYFAMNAQQGFYWFGSRYSSPVISKRMNPLLSFRWWAVDAEKNLESDDNFVEVLYGHESNGQRIDTPDAFAAQVATYERRLTPRQNGDDQGEAFRQARDNISRGWDYLGVQFSRDWDWGDQAEAFWTLNLRAKYQYYLPHGLLQGAPEEYRTWELDPEGKPRKYVDGVSFRITGVRREAASRSRPINWLSAFAPDRFAVTWTTGYVRFGRFNTIKVEEGLPLLRLVPVVGKLPVMVWYRYGYNSSRTNYYRQDHSFGVKLSIWKFTTED